MQVIIFGDTSSTNLGDPILTNSAEYIVRQCFDNILETKIVDIMDRKKHSSSTSIVVLKKNTFIKRIFIPFFVLLKWYLKHQKIYKKKLINLISDSKENVFLIAGGALLSNSLPYALRLGKIVSFANEKNIPVIFNAVGIEKSVKKGISRFFIRKMLKSPNIKGFATRDNIEDILFLTNRKDCYKKNCDPGIFASEAYNISKKESQTVGIGVISVEAYKSISFENKKALYITEDYLIDFWNSIIVKLEENNIDWKLFTNGGEKDYSIACKLIEKYGYRKEKLLPRPQKPEELIEQISNFSSVVAHRLHSLIISTSLEIPIIPILWSNKVLEFAKVLGISDITFWPDNICVPVIINKLLEKDFSANGRMIFNLKNSAINNLNNIFLNLELSEND